MHSLTLSLCVKNCRKASFNNGGGNLHLIHLRRSKCEDENNEKQQGMVDQRRDGGPGPNNLDWPTGPKQSRLADLAQTISRFAYVWHWKQNAQQMQCVSIFVDFSFKGISWTLHCGTMHLFLFVEDGHLTLQNTKAVTEWGIFTLLRYLLHSVWMLSVVCECVLNTDLPFWKHVKWSPETQLLFSQTCPKWWRRSSFPGTDNTNDILVGLMAHRGTMPFRHHSTVVSTHCVSWISAKKEQSMTRHWLFLHSSYSNYRLYQRMPTTFVPGRPCAADGLLKSKN